MSDEGFGCCSFFHYFCPPCAKQITEKVAFNPPSSPYYQLTVIDAKLYDFAFMLSEEVDVSGMKSVKKQRARFVKTSLGNSIAVLYVNCNEDKKYTIIYSHGNAVDLGQIHKLSTEISFVFKCDVVCYDYSGYGRSEGRPTEENLYADINAVWDYTLALHEPRPEKIILFGQSLGTAPTIDLASKVQCAGVVLQSPFKSCLSVACPNHSRLCFCTGRFNK